MKMKQLLVYFLVTTMALSLFSCDNNGRQNEKQNEETTETEKYFSYEVLLDSYQNYRGLAILYGDDNNRSYLMFDDEATYYNDCIYEWNLARNMAFELLDYNRIRSHRDNPYCNGDKEQIIQKLNEYLKCVHCMPSCLDKYVVTDDIAREVFLETYYNLQDYVLYEPIRRYGSWNYPTGGYLYGRPIYIEIFRVDDGYNVPKGTLAIQV